MASAQLKQPGVNAPGKNFWHGLTGRDSLSISRVWIASLVVPGYSQAYNRDYWKIPVIWGGIGGLVGYGLYNHQQYKKTGDTHYQHLRNWSYLGAAAIYWGSLLDGVVSYHTGADYVPARATIYSTMLPGLGQIYNGEYWKLPIVYGALAFTLYYVDFQSRQYNRYQAAYQAVNDDDPNTIDEFKGRVSKDKLKYYRDNSRRSRDYGILFTVLTYALNVIDANVFATLKDFDVSDDLSLRIHPAVLNYDYAGRSDNIVFGVQMQWTF
jgi:hypothetical protein